MPADSKEDEDTRSSMLPAHPPPDAPALDSAGLDPQDVQCGWGSCRPSWMQCFTNMKMFTLVLSMISIMGSMNFSYYTSVITQIEKCFGLSSTMVGLLKNVDNIGYLLAAVFVSHFGRYANKPKLFSIATIGTSIAIFLFSLPHFIYGPGDFSGVSVGNMSAARAPAKYELCDGVDESDADGCSRRSYLLPMNKGALVIFFMSELLQGIAQSPKFVLSITYMDDNAKAKSPLYYGFMLGMRSLAPLLGFLLGAWCVSLYVTLEDTELEQKDPRWVGAWWLGFVICSLCSIVWVLPLSLFPPVLPGETNSGYKKTMENKEVMADFKDLPKAILRILSNPVYMIVLLGACFHVLISGYGTFLPKYLEMGFGLTASKASILTGCIGSASFSLGPIISGQIMARTNSAKHAMTFLFILHSIAAVGFLAMTFVGCPQDEWAGDLTLDSVNLTMACNSDCSCDPFMFTPVCGSDGLNYFSPCHAGCSNFNFTGSLRAFTDCQCIPDGIATVGQCEKDCNMLIPYLIILSITSFTMGMHYVPLIGLQISLVSEKDKSLSIALFSCFILIVAFPAPVLFGYMIDLTCLVTQATCQRQGACLLYESDTFRLWLHGFSALIKCCSALVYLVAMVIVKKRGTEKEEPKEDGEQTNEMLAL